MGIRDRISSLVRSSAQDDANPRGEEDFEYQINELREFVYLDRDSVVSLLASIEGTIKQERVEQIGEKSERAVEGEVKASISGVGADIHGKHVDIGESSTEVVHNYAIQSLFDELDRHRRNSTDLGVLQNNPATEANNDNLEDDISISLSELERGNVLNVDVELETHYLYRFYNVLQYVEENIPQAIDPNDKDVLDLIGSMFGTEVPVTGKLRGYRLEDGELRKTSDEAEGEPVEIVGQLNLEKLWQDIPNALFTGQEYTVFCRVMRVPTEDEWYPLSLAQKMESISPPLGKAVHRFMDKAAILAKEEAIDIDSEISNRHQYFLEKLSEFDSSADIGAISDEQHEEFLAEYLAANEVGILSTASVEEQKQFYDQYLAFLSNRGFDISSSRAVEIQNELITSETPAIEDIEVPEQEKSQQIEVNFIAIYW